MLQSYNMSGSWVKDLLGFNTIIPFEKEYKTNRYITERWSYIGQCAQTFQFLQHFKKESFRPSPEIKERERKSCEASCSLETPVYFTTSHILFISKCLKHLLSLPRCEMSSVQVWLGGGRYLLAERRSQAAFLDSSSWHLELVIKPLPSGQLFTSV